MGVLLSPNLSAVELAELTGKALSGLLAEAGALGEALSCLFAEVGSMNKLLKLLRLIVGENASLNCNLGASENT